MYRMGTADGGSRMASRAVDAPAGAGVAASNGPGTGPRWHVAQIGHREEYAAARAAAASGRLAALYTDVWCRHGAATLAVGPSPLRRLALRHHAALRDERVVAWTGAGTVRQAVAAVRRRVGDGTRYDEFLRYGQWFDATVRHRLRREPPAPGDAFLGFTSGCLATLQHLRAGGVTALVDQIDPGRREYELVLEEAERWPGWEPRPAPVPDAYFDRVRAEWDAAAGVVVNSSWSARLLVEDGVGAERITVLPLAYEPNPPPVPRRPGDPHAPLTVLWLGSVILRKGIQYLVEAAKLLSDRTLRIKVVGPVGISEAAVRSAPASVEFVGDVTHNLVSQHYATADVFVLPTVSDGFAQTQLEAMAHGVPVVTTPNCGDVVDPGRDGLIVPAGDPHGLAAALASLDEDRDLLARMTELAPLKAKQFSLDHYRAGLDAAALAASARA